MRRRHLLHAAASFGAAAAAGRVFAAPAAGSRLLLVFLRGGYDANSLLVPLASTFYREARPNIAVPIAAEGTRGAIPIDGDWGLHPALEPTILPLVRAGQASFVPFAGSDDTSRSHFETQDTIELGQPTGAHRDFSSGFLNRLVSVLGRSDAIAFTDQLPLVLRGRTEVANVSLRSVPPAGDMRLRQALVGMYRGHALGPRVDEAFDVRDEVARDMAGEMESASRNALSPKGFELEARRMARLMRERYALGFIDVGGWDTHVGQGAATGYLATRLEELGRGLAGFADELGSSAWRDTVVVVLSEFGRTLRENGNRGTDHGHGSVYWVLGGSLASKPVVGEQVPLEARTLFQNRDMPVLTEVRAMLGGLFVRQFGLSPAQLQAVFPGVRPRELKLL